MSITAPVFDIQRFSLHDGPGIRSLVFLKGCALHCPWCQNPESQDHRAVVGFQLARCLRSFECRDVCPENAILDGDFRVEGSRCTVCGLCVDACPTGALRLIGEDYTPEQLMEKLCADRPYYESSGGGVTFTGGEPTRHPRFVERVLDLCREESIHTNLETAGLFSFERWAPILKKLDLIYFDLKIMVESEYDKHLGGDFETIVQNAIALAQNDLPVEFRMPVIPGFTDTASNIEATLDVLERAGKDGIHLLAYHNMGEAKIDLIRGSQPRLGLPTLSDSRLDEVREEFRSRGIEILNAD
jgi:pyruvate formate lyase activating enzyme